MGSTLTRRDLALLVALTLMWGVNWPMMKLSLREITPLWFRAVTMSCGAGVLLAFYAWRGHDMRLPRREALTVLWLALPNIIGWHCFSIVGLSHLASGRAAILGFTMPVWTVLLGVLFMGERLTPRVWVSAVMATAAVGLLSAQEFAQIAGRPVGVAWMQVAAVCWAAGTLLMRRTATRLPNEAVTVWMLVMGAAFFLVTAAALEPLPQPGRFSAAMWASLAFGALVNYGYAQVIWFGMARRLPPTASAFSVMAVPLVGTASALAIVGEVPQLLDGLAAVCVVVAIASALLPPRGRKALA